MLDDLFKEFMDNFFGASDEFIRKIKERQNGGIKTGGAETDQGRKTVFATVAKFNKSNCCKGYATDILGQK